MKKILPAVFGALFLGFVVGVFALVLSLSYAALGHLFPDSVENQAAGLLLYDAAALIWGGVFVYQSRSIGQYVVAAFGFLVGLAGTLALVAIETQISSGLVDVASMLKPLTDIFILSAVAHLCLGYAYKAMDPDVDADISLGVEQAKITADALRQTEESMQAAIAQMGAVIAARMAQRVYRNLNIPNPSGDMQSVLEPGRVPVEGIVTDPGVPVDAAASAPKMPVGGIMDFFSRWLLPWGRQKQARVYEATTAGGAAKPVGSPSNQGGTAEDTTAAEPVSSGHTVIGEKKEPLYHPDLSAVE
jgi:hypothetical protein